MSNTAADQTTIIFLNTAKKMSFYDFSHLQRLKQENFNMVALVKQGDSEEFTAFPGNVFDAIIEVESATEEMGLDTQSCIDAIQSLSAGHLVIACNSEDNLLTAARIRAEFGLSGLDVDTSTAFRDKVIMKTRLQSANIRVPKFGRLAACDERAYLAIVEHVGSPFILKPTQELGSAGVALVASAQQLAQYGELLNGQSEYEYEEFIDGDLYHYDGILLDGDVVFDAACEYTNPNFNFTKGRSVISMPLPDSSLVKELKAFGLNAVKALGLVTGVFHLEAFRKNGEWIFLECAARAPGAVVIPMYEKQYGINLLNLSLDVELGKTPTVEVQTGKHYFSGILPRLEGTITALQQPPLNSQFSLKHFVGIGDTLSAAKSLREIASTIEASSDSYETLRNDFELMKGFSPLVVA